MKSKFDYKKSQVLVEKTNLPEINRKIRALIEEYKSEQGNRIGRIYEILSKLVRLRKELYKKYYPANLSQDKELNLKPALIRMIFSYKYLSEKSKKLIAENKIKDSVVCFLISRWYFLREPQWQDRAVDAAIKGLFTRGGLSEYKIRDIKELLINGVQIKENTRYIHSCSKSLRSMLMRFQNRDIFKEKDYLNILIRPLEKMLKYLKTGEKQTK